jgi:hypothetical protein
VAQLTQGVLKTMFLKKLTFAGILLASLVVAGTGGGVALHQALAERPNKEFAMALAPAPSEDIQPKKLLDQALKSVDKIENVDGKAWALVEIGRALAEASEREQAAKAFELASRSARDISDEFSGSRSSILLWLAGSQAMAGLIDDAFKTADAIVSETTSHKGQALAMIAGKQLGRGDRKGALKTVEQIKETEKDFALGEFARIEAESGDFKKALETSAGIRNGFRRVEALCTIAQCELKAGDKEGSHEVIQTAFDLAKSLVVKNNPGLRYSALTNVAWLQASAGNMKAAWQTINLLEKGSFKNSAMVSIIKALADQGKIEEALKTVNDIEGKKDQGLRQIALAQAKAKKFKEALTIATSIVPNIRSDTLLEIGKMQARAGDLTGATDSFARALKDLDKPEVLWLQDGVVGAGPRNVHSALMAYGESGLGKEGLAWANAQKSPFVKAVALAGLAEGLAKRLKQEKEQPDNKSSQKQALQAINELLDQAMKDAKEIQRRPIEAFVLTKIGMVQAAVGQQADAAKIFEMAEKAIRNSSDLNPEGSTKQAMLLQIADGQLQMGDFDSALQTVESIFSGEKAIFKSQFLAQVAIAQLRAGKKDLAFETLRKTWPHQDIFLATSRTLAKLQAEQGDVAGALQTIEQSIKNSASKGPKGPGFTITLDNIRAILEIASIQRKAGDKKAGLETIRKALDIAQKLDPSDSADLKNPKHLSLAEVAGALAQAGEIKEAFQIADSLDLTYGKDPALTAIAVAQAQQGDIDGARKSLESVRKGREAVRVEIAIAEARAMKWKEALKGAESLEAKEDRAKVLTEIGKLQVQKGDEAAGLASFQMAIDAVKDDQKPEPLDFQRPGTSWPESLYQIMVAEGEAGVARKARAWIDKQDSPFVKAMALTGLAEGLVNRQKPSAKPKEKQSNAQAAEKDFQIAEFYRRTGHPGSAHFYYDLVIRGYPETTFGKMAKERLSK